MMKMISSVQRQIIKSRKIPNIFIDRIGNRHFSSDGIYGDDRETAHEFRVLDLRAKKDKLGVVQTEQRTTVADHRYKKMKVDQDWGAVWSGPKTFHPSSVPLPLNQGLVTTTTKVLPSPGKFANAELMKIPNFLHLTPPVVKTQCEAIKKFCTPWPDNLKTKEKCEEHFPIQYITSDYCHGLPTIRNPLARIVALKFKLASLKLSDHAKDKFLRLVENRYDTETDVVTITADRCPTRKQNFEYVQYLLTALYHESWVVEPWEEVKTEADMEYYDWEKNASKKSMEAVLRWNKSTDEPIPSLDAYASTVENLFNVGETLENIDEYKAEVMKLLGLQSIAST